MAAVLAGALSTVAVVAFWRAVTPDPRVPYVSAKLQRWQEVGGDVDVLFLGSDLIYRQLSPQVFSRVVERRAGLALSAFNLGIPDAGAIETRYLVERLGSHRPRHLRWVLLAVDDGPPMLRPGEVAEPGRVWWHGGRETLDAIRSAWRLATLAEVWIQTQRHARSWVFHQLAVGRLSALLRDRFGAWTPPEERPEVVLGPARDGFAPYEAGDLAFKSYRRRSFVAELDTWKREVAARVAAGAPSAKGCLEPVPRRELQRLVASVRALGAEPVFLVSPNLSGHCYLAQAAAEGVVPHVLGFDDPARFRELFAAEQRYDGTLLSRPGAIVYSRLVALSFSKLLAREGSGSSHDPVAKER